MGRAQDYPQTVEKVQLATEVEVAFSEKFRRLAKSNERSVSAEMRLALAAHLAAQTNGKAA